MIIEEIKLKLDLAMYKGKTRLRQWYPIVLGHMKEIETAQNNLADKVTEEDNRISGVLNTALNEAAEEHEALEGKITAEAKSRADEIRRLYYSSLPCYDFGSYYVYDGSTTYSTINDYRLYNAIFTAGKLIAFKIADRDTDTVEIWDGGVVFGTGKKSTIVINYPFKNGHSYKAIITGSGTAEVVLDNGVLVKLEAETDARKHADDVLQKSIEAEEIERARVDRSLSDNLVDIAAALAAETKARETADDNLQEQIDALKENGTGGGISGTLATEEMIKEIIKNATPGIYVPDSTFIGLATDAQIEEMF